MSTFNYHVNLNPGLKRSINYNLYPTKQIRVVEKPKIPLNVYKDMNELLKLEDFKDFTVKIADSELKVHKLMLAARSPTLAEMIKNNPDADELILEDIEVEVFEVILDYIYNDVMPDEFDEKSVKVFAAAGKLKLEALNIHVVKILCNAVNPENALEILKLASKHQHQELKLKAFGEFKKLFPGKHIKDELINDLEKLKKLCEAKKNHEEKLKQMKKEFVRLLNNYYLK